jgi:hypothetical protein
LFFSMVRRTDAAKRSVRFLPESGTSNTITMFSKARAGAAKSVVPRRPKVSESDVIFKFRALQSSYSYEGSHA